MIYQIEQLKQELNKKEAEMQTLQTKLDTLTNQNSDCKQHIEVLKESLSAKDQRANTLQTEVSVHIQSPLPPTHCSNAKNVITCKNILICHHIENGRILYLPVNALCKFFLVSYYLELCALS